MSKLILGDNPFFGVSHLSSDKTREYLADSRRLENAANIIRTSVDLGINKMMISAHSGSVQLLTSAGYPAVKSLPELCVVIPNVHQINTSASEKGTFGAIMDRLRNLSLKTIFTPKLLFKKLLLGELDFPQVKYIALHNVIVDMLLGLRCSFGLRIFCLACKTFGYTPVLITLNPKVLVSQGIKNTIICTYYNLKGYNVVGGMETVRQILKNNPHQKFWAMGIAASGAVEESTIISDQFLSSFDGILIASSRLDRLSTLSSGIRENLSD